jgi:hypothetical protein
MNVSINFGVEVGGRLYCNTCAEEYKDLKELAACEANEGDIHFEVGDFFACSKCNRIIENTGLINRGYDGEWEQVLGS